MIYLLLAVGLIAADQLIKAWVVAHLAIGETIGFIPGVLSLTHIKNTGAAFSMLEGKQWFFYVITVAAIAVVIWLWKDSKGYRTYRLGLVFILAGAIGNFIDRLRQGFVTDMFQVDFMNFAIFNFADACLTVGVILVLIHLLFFDGKKPVR